jgi:hypothetical protein
MDSPFISKSDSDGTPVFAVSADCLWNLIEYLSYQRVTVHYCYESGRFTVTFPRLDHASARRLLDEWAVAQMRICA